MICPEAGCEAEKVFLVERSTEMMAFEVVDYDRKPVAAVVLDVEVDRVRMKTERWLECSEGHQIRGSGEVPVRWVSAV